MKSTIKLLSCLCVCLSLQSPAFSDFTSLPEKSPVIVLQGEVTIDGQQRPDLGRSFSDTLTGGFLKTKTYSVIDHLGNQPLAQAIESSHSLAPEQSAVSLATETGARWIYVPRMIVEGEFHKLTLKKIRVSDGQIVDVFEAHASGDRTTMFLLIGEALKDIYTKAARDPAHLGKSPTGEPSTPSKSEAEDSVPEPDPTPGSYTDLPAPAENGEEIPAEIATEVSQDTAAETLQETAAEKPEPTETTEVVSSETRHIPEGLKLENGTFVRADPPASKTLQDIAEQTKLEATKINDPATELENRYARYVGLIKTVNSEWRFCILKLRDSKSLNIGDKLSVKTGSIVPNEVTLKLTKIDGSQAVADLVDDTDLDAIKTGQKVYEWTLK